VISVDEARRRILARMSPVSSEIVTLDRAWGRVLAADLSARRTQPPFDASAMDGYAVRTTDLAALPALFDCIGTSQAGAGFSGTLAPGQAVRIFTGAPVPAGADAVVIQEDAEADGANIRIREAVPPGANIRRAGADFTTGTVGLRRGTRLSARAIGLAGAMNHPWVEVFRRPRIAVLATGDEVVLPGEPVGPAQIIGANGPAVAAVIRAAGGEPVLLPVAADTPAALALGIAAARGCDLLVTIGGASVGDHDLVRNVLGEQGLSLDFWKIAMRPGKPLLFGALGTMPVLGLPGNPVSALMTALIFLRPAIDALQGVADPDDGTETVAAAIDLPANGPRQDYARATLERNTSGILVARPVASQDSSLTRALAAADCLLIRPPHAPAVAAGTFVPMLRLGLY
jgi:molybdopterin molybdotransferase